MQVLSHANSINFQMRNAEGHIHGSWVMDIRYYGWASSQPYNPSCITSHRGHTVTGKMSAWGCIRKLRSQESQPYGSQVWGSLAASQLLSSNACIKAILPSTLNSNKVWLKTCSNCTLSDARYLILSSLGSFAIWSKRDLDLFQTFTVEACSMAWSHWVRREKKTNSYWRSDYLPLGKKTHGSLHAFPNLSTVGVTFSCSTRKSPLCLEADARFNIMIPFFPGKHRTPNSSDDDLPTSLSPLTETVVFSRAFLLAKLSLLQTSSSKPQKRIRRATSSILAVLFVI